MNTLITINRRTRWLATMAATLGTLLTAGGPLMLAEHYAQTEARRNASGYHATAQSACVACDDREETSLRSLPRARPRTPNA